ncbi:MAG: head decoration protein [Deltaproteobacteria bacterium]|jgi:hypothetical protein|nr:head decoration protein [Deltaproteobacteria bacterium]
MSTDLIKAPVLSDLIKSEQANYLGREAAKVTSSAALAPGTVLQGGPGAAIPWDLSDPTEIYAVLLTAVPADSTPLDVAVLYAGPASVNPDYLVWDNTASAQNIVDGLAELKARHFIFTREPVTSSLYPGQINRVPD